MKLIPNPCKSICKIKDKTCIGCNRTVEEISNWSKLSNVDKQIIIDRIKNTYNGPDISQHLS
jgi:predicted Fe-S protein YdhL (DUF1289 family)